MKTLDEARGEVRRLEYAARKAGYTTPDGRELVRERALWVEHCRVLASLPKPKRQGKYA